MLRTAQSVDIRILGFGIAHQSRLVARLCGQVFAGRLWVVIGVYTCSICSKALLHVA